MKSFEKAKRELELRTERARIYKELSKHGFSTSRKLAKSKLSSPTSLAVLLGSGVFLGTLRSRNVQRLNELQKGVDDIYDKIAANSQPMKPETEESVAEDDIATLISSDVANFVSSIATSLVARYLFAQFFTDQEPELNLDGDV